MIPGEPQSQLRALFDLLPGVVVTYDTETVQPGVTTVVNLTIAMKTPAGIADPQNKVTIARAEAQNLDIDAIGRVFDAARYSATPDQTFRMLASKLTLTGVAMTLKGKPVATIASWSFDGLEMKPFGFVPGGPNFMAQFKSPDLAFIQIAGHVQDSMKQASSTASGIKVELEMADMMAMYPPGVIPPGTNVEGRILYEIGSFTQGRVDRGIFGPGSMRDLVAKSPASPGVEITQTFREMTVDGADISKLLPWAMKAELPPVSREPLWSYGAFCAIDQTITLPEIGTFSSPRNCMEPISTVWLIPEKVDYNLTGTFTPQFSGPYTLPAYAADYFREPLDVAARISFSYDPDKGLISLDHYMLRLESFGSVDFAVVGGGYELDTLLSLDKTYREKLSLVSGGMTIVDEGGIAKILAMSAAASSPEGGAKVEPEALKLQAKAGIDLGVGMLGNTPEVAAMGAAAKAFLDNGGTLVATVTPPTPLKAADFEGMAAKGPAGILTALGLKVEHTAP